MRVTPIVVVLLFGCGPKDKKPTEIQDRCEKWSYHPKSADEFACVLEFGEPEETIFLRQGKQYTVDFSLHRDVSLKGIQKLDNGWLERTRVEIPNVVTSQSLTLEAIELLSTTVAISGDTTFKDTTIQAETFTVRGASSRMQTVDLDIEKSIDVQTQNLFWRGVRDAFDTAETTLDFKTAQILESEFSSQVTLTARETAYVHHSNFSGSVSVDGPVFFERNCVKDKASTKFSSRTVRNENRYGNCVSWIGGNWCTGDVELTDLGPGFDREKMLIGDFDGNRKDEIIRVEPEHWHLMNTETLTWKLIRKEKTTPWTLGVGDFDRDGRDDVFEANGASFRFLSGARGKWKVLQDADAGFARQYLQVADIDGDGQSDVLKPGPGDLLHVSRGGDKPFEEYPTTLGDPTTRWLGNVNFKPGAEWITITNNDVYSYSFQERVRKKLDFLSAPRPLEATSFGMFKDGVMCQSDSFWRTCSGSHGGSGAGGSEPGWRHFETGDFDGDEKLELVSSHCGTADPCHANGDSERLVTYNVNHAGIRSVEELAREVAWLDASVVVLQEVDRNTKRNPYDMAERIKTITGFAHSKFFKSNDYQGGEYGQMVLSQQPLLDIDVINLPDHDDPDEWSEHYIAISFKSGDRTYLTAHVINDVWRNGVDLSETQKKQIDQLAKEVAKRKPDVVLGDFNMLPSSEVYKRFVKKTGYVDAWDFSDGPGITFPDHGGAPRRIDYMFLKKTLAPVCLDVPALITSDHYPLIIGFEPSRDLD